MTQTKHYPHHIDLKPVMHAEGTVRLPGSKSISNRVLLLAALSAGETHVKGLLDADDTRVMLDALQKLDIKIDSRNFAESQPLPSGNSWRARAGSIWLMLT